MAKDLNVLIDYVKKIRLDENFESFTDSRLK